MTDPENDGVEALKALVLAQAAQQYLLSARIDALQQMVVAALEQLGYRSRNHPSLHSALQALFALRCNETLAALSDDDPNVAATLKGLVDRALE